jgi:hypothetical protein
MVSILPDKLLCRLLCLTTTMMLISASVVMAGEPDNSSAHPGNKADSIFIFKKVLSKSYKISLYPDASQQVVFFSVQGTPGKVYQLYVFDLDGKLIKQSEIRNKQTTHIRDIGKGVYLFDVFSDDDRIGNGQLTVR